MPSSSWHSSMLMAGKMTLVSELKPSLSCLHVPRPPAPYTQHGRLDKPETPCSSFSFCENSCAAFFPHVPRGNQSMKATTYKLNSPDPTARQAAAHGELKIKYSFSLNCHDLLQQCCSKRCLQTVFYMYKKTCLAESKARALGKKKPEQAETAVPISLVLSLSEQNGSFPQFLPNLSRIRSNHRNFKATMSHLLFFLGKT